MRIIAPVTTRKTQKKEKVQKVVVFLEKIGEWRVVGARGPYDQPRHCLKRQ